MSITQSIVGNSEPVKEICSVFEILAANARPIISELNNDNELCTELIKAFTSMAEAMLKEQIILDKDYVVAIFRFFHVLIVEFYGPLI